MHPGTNRLTSRPARLLDSIATPERSPHQRIGERTFPSVFQAWNPADIPGEEKWTSAARHDILFHAPDYFGLRWADRYPGLATAFTPDSIQAATRIRKLLLERNPNIVLLAELRYRDAHRSHIPDGHAWWMTKNGKPVIGWEEGGYFLLDFANPNYQDHIARQAKTIMATGVMDGIMLDWWDDDDSRISLIQKIRRSIGHDALIMVNANDRKVTRSAKLINGLFMECYRSATPADWERIKETLLWAEANVQRPRINCLETWFQTSRDDVARMRATTTLVLTLSDGYCLFSDPNPLPTPDHSHDWYPFWNRSLGKPTEKGRALPDGSYQRRFTNGIAVYNPPGNKPVNIQLAKPHTAVSTGTAGKSFTVLAGDGDIYLNHTSTL
jgi:hypothetical protein